MITNEYINRAIDYILTHANKDISIDQVAAHCGFSRFYFSRLFKEETGESIGEFIRRVKMEQSAFRLKVERGRNVTDISYDYGYSSSNFSTAFKQHHEMSPIEFRRRIMDKSKQNPIYTDAVSGLESFDLIRQKVTTQNFDECLVLYQRYKGNYGDLSAHWGEFQETYKEYITDETVFIERTYDDPSITDVDECLYDICIAAPSGCEFENTYVMNGGKFAVYHFYGEVRQLYTAYQSMFNVWMPLSGYEIDDRYGFEIYRHIDCNALEGIEPGLAKMQVDLCLPIK